MVFLLWPLVFAVYPIVFLYSRYTDEANNVLWYFALSTAFGLVAIALNYFYFGRKENISAEYVNLKTLVASSLIIVLFATFGHVYNELYHFSKDYWLDRNANVLDRQLVMFSRVVVGFIWVLVLFFGYRFITRVSLESLREIAKAIMIFGLCLIILPVFSISKAWLFPKSAIQKPLTEEVKHIDAQTSLECNDCTPDIYYIILDGYARADILDQFYDFNNDDFLKHLDSLGFAVVENARSNYFATFLSLSSSLNMEYIDAVIEDFDLDVDEEDAGRYMFGDPIRDNLVSRELRKRGYKYVHMASTWGLTRYNPYADIEYDCDASMMQNDFDRVFIEGTLLSIFSNQVSADIAHCHLSNYYWLGELAPEIPGPKFVFAHFIQPHHPYLFDSKGNILRYATLSDQFEFQKFLWGDRAAYIEQLQFVNFKVLEAVENILKKSKRPPIIIIQSDHGPHLWDKAGNIDEENYAVARNGILLAVHAPDKVKNIPVRTPVNLFRYIFSRYLSYEMDYYPDRYFKSSHSAPFRFEEMKN